MYWVYAIRAVASGRVYIGQTSDLDRRLEMHNRGAVRSTRDECPWDLVASQECETRNAARWLERCLKRSRGRRLRWLDCASQGLRAGGGPSEDMRLIS